MLQHASKARIVCASAIMLALVFTISTISYAAASAPDVRSFFHSLAGDWIGTCEQSTDGKQADNKYFHATVRQAGPNSFESRFDYYRLDERTGSPIKIGTSTMTTTVAADGTVKNSVTGSGQVRIDKDTTKPQEHQLCEVLTMSSTGGLTGKGTGTIKVSGMPLGLGKNGKVKDDHSTWSLCDGVLRISQRLKIGFSAFLMSKSFTVAANFTAKRGSDVVALMMNQRAYFSRLGGASRR